MKTGTDKSIHQSGVTLVELLVTLTLMAVACATLLPVFSVIRRNWDMTMGDSEITQNARVLFDHMHRQLAQARELVALSDGDEKNGSLVFGSFSGETLQYEKTDDRTIRFGPPASPATLVGPVHSFQIQGYDLHDMTRAISDVNRIRMVEVQVEFPNSSDPDRMRTCRSSFFLRSAKVAAGDLPRRDGYVSAP